MGMSVQDVAVRFMGIYQAQFDGLREAGAEVAFSLDAPDSSAADYTICTAHARDIQSAAAQTDAATYPLCPPHRPMV